MTFESLDAAFKNSSAAHYTLSLGPGYAAFMREVNANWHRLIGPHKEIDMVKWKKWMRRRKRQRARKKQTTP